MTADAPAWEGSFARRLGLAVAISLFAHTALLLGFHLDLRPRYLLLPEAARARARVVYRPALPRFAAVDLPAASATMDPRRIEIRRQRTIHLPASEPPAAAPRRSPTVVATAPLPRLRPAQRPPDDELTLALVAASEKPVATMHPKGGTVRLALLPPGQPPAPLFTGEQPGLLVIASATSADPSEQLPGGADGWSWTALDADDAIFQQPQDVRDWWRECGQPEILLGSRAGRPAAVCLPLCVRAGWEARVPAARRLWQNVLNDPRLAPAIVAGSGNTPTNRESSE